MATFSILLLCSQSHWSIRDAIQSVLAQSFTDWECLICDDASKDGTEALVLEYLGDARFRYHRHPSNVGQGANWGVAIAKTSAPYIATLHADDVWLPNAIATYWNAFVHHENCDIVSAGWERTDSDLRVLAHQPPARRAIDCCAHEAVQRILLENPILPSASAFRRSVAESSGLPNVNYGMLCDREYFLRLAAHSRRFVIAEELIMLYRVHDASVTAKYSRNHRLVSELQDFDCQLADFLRDIPQREQLLMDYRRQIADFYFRSGLTLFQQGEVVRAKQIIGHALQNDAGLLRDPKRLAKWILYRCGPFGRLVLPMIHSRNKYVNELV